MAVIDSGSAHRQYDLPRGLRTIPFTLEMLAIIVSVAIVTRTHLGPLSDDVLRRIGFAPLHLPALEWHRALTSVFVTVGGATFYVSLAMLAFNVGTAERLFGAKRT